MKPDRRQGHSHKIPRKDAVEVLDLILYQGASSTDVLNERLSGYDNARDSAFLHTLVTGVVRNLSLLQELIRQVSSRPLMSISRRVLLALYTGTYQVIFLDRVPDHAAVDETVKVVRSFNRRAVSFANA